MRIVVDPTLGRGDADLAQHLDRLLAGLLLADLLVDPHGFFELVADPTLPEGCNASRLEVVSDSGELNMYRLGRAMPDNPKTGVLTALTMADELMKIVRSSDW